MMRSLFSGVSGLKTHQTKMDVIGNNIANVNTVAFKSSSVTFSDLMSQTTQSASGPNASTGTGGVNARQIGLGVKSGAINTNISTQGSAQSTGNPFDIMITGDAFFVVNNGVDNFFTRDGSFYVDGAGNLAMTSTGYNVMGWHVDETTGKIKQDTVKKLQIMGAENMTYPPEATSKAYVSGIIDKHDTDVTSVSGKTMNLNFYDALGYSYSAKLTMKQNAEDPSLYSLELTGLLDSEGVEVDGWENVSLTGAYDSVNNILNQDNLPYIEQETIVTFNDTEYKWDGTALKLRQYDDAGNELEGEVVAEVSDGITSDEWKAIATAYGYEDDVKGFRNQYINIPQDDGNGNMVDVKFSLQKLITNLSDTGNVPKITDATITVGNQITAAGYYYDGVQITYDPDTGVFAGINGNQTVSTLNIDFSAISGNFSNVEVDFSESSMFDNKGTSTIGATSGDLEGLGTGRRLGDMIGVSIQNNGMIYASYDNGMTKLLGQIATAEFANASGLEKQGDNLYSATLNSGEFDGIGVDITGNGGYMSTGVLEMSNVDLSSEFTEMITTQRGFQANSRIITVSDTMLEELTNLKR
ncbi:MAG: flagellar hook-basal body complex protein [Lachnospiraceae bacterium]|nr:flagellar hook-basal body complex protein [Lachnospiraceae bacterium]